MQFKIQTNFLIISTLSHFLSSIKIYFILNWDFFANIVMNIYYSSLFIGEYFENQLQLLTSVQKELVSNSGTINYFINH